jgi:hypothetical protein
MRHSRALRAALSGNTLKTPGESCIEVGINHALGRRVPAGRGVLRSPLLGRTNKREFRRLTYQLTPKTARIAVFPVIWGATAGMATERWARA